MEQRRLRLGDILDDYCPRERRVTNHAIVAMVEEDVKQTRCTTCDAEHVYKGGKQPRRKKTETTGKLYKQVLAGLTDDPINPSPAAPEREPERPGSPVHDDEPESAPEPIEVLADAPADAHDDEVDPDMPDNDDEPQPSFNDDGPVHRPLIRAQLPRVEGVKIERQAPDFTIRQNAGGRGGNGHFRGGHQNNGNNNGHRFGRGPQRGGGRDGRGQQGFGGGRPGQGQQRNNKRGR